MEKDGHIIEGTGLSMDYKNAWVPLGLIHLNHSMQILSDAEFRNRIAEPVKTYIEYLTSKHYPVEKYRKCADASALCVLDKIVAEYNALSLDARMQTEAFAPYWDKCESIILGQTPE